MQTISLPAVLKRINRKLAKEDKRLCVARLYRSGHEDSNLGRYYILNTSRNEVIDYRVKPQDVARDLGVLQLDEVLAV